MFAIAASFFAVFLYLTLYLQTVLGMSPIAAETEQRRPPVVSDHCGVRHMHQSVGPSGTLISPVTSNPCRRYSSRLRSLVASR